MEYYFRNATFSRETEGLQNLNAGVEWFKTTHSTATINGQNAVVRPLFLQSFRKPADYRNGEKSISNVRMNCILSYPLGIPRLQHSSYSTRFIRRLYCHVRPRRH